MPLVEVHMNPAFCLKVVKFIATPPTEYTLSSSDTAKVVKDLFARDIPMMLLQSADTLRLTPGTPEEGIQVTRHEFDSGDINAPDVWVKVQFSENRPELDERLGIRDVLYTTLLSWFHHKDFCMDNFVVDIFWGPTNGLGKVDGVEIKW